MSKINLDCEIKDNDPSKIFINCANLPKNIKVIDASIILKVLTVTNGKSFGVDFITDPSAEPLWKNLDRLSALSENEEFTLNITDEVQEAIKLGLSDFILEFTKDNPSDILTVEKLTKIDDYDVEYLSMAEYEAYSPSHEVNLGSAGSGNISLVTGNLQISKSLTSMNNNVLPLNVTNVYNTVTSNYVKNNSGNGWKLNLEQYIVERTKTVTDNGIAKEVPSGEYIYIDENGKEQIIIEKYYYLDNNNKIFVNRENLSMGLDGNLLFNLGTDSAPDFKEIKTELKAPSGLKMVTSKKDIKGADLVDDEPEEFIQIKQNIDDLQKNMENIEYNLGSYRKQIVMQALSKDALEKQLMIQNYNIVAKDKLVNLNCLTDPYRNNVFDLAESDEKQFKILEYNYTNDITQLDAKINKLHKYLNNTKIDEVMFNNFLKNTLNVNDYKKIVENYIADLYYDFKFSADFKGIMFSTDVNLGIGIITNPPMAAPPPEINDNIKLAKKDLLAIDIQLEDIIKNYYLLNDKQTILKEQLKKLKHQQAEYERQLPKFYLYNDNVILGFSPIITEETINGETTYTKTPHIYRLNYITDSYENAISINYDGDQIKSVVDSQDNVITFNYESNLLKEIVDALENKVSLEYNNGLLTKIVWGENFSKYFYSNNRLIGALNSSGQGAVFTHNPNGTIKSVQEVSALEKIENGQAIFKNNVNINEITNLNDYLLSDAKLIIDYYDYKTTIITDAKDKSVVYNFDSSGNVRTMYENRFNELNPQENNVIVKSFDYRSENEKYVAEAIINSANFLDDLCFNHNTTILVPANYLGNGLLEGSEIYCGDDIYLESYPTHTSYHELPATEGINKAELSISVQNLAKLNEQNTKNLILSAWAKADSAFVPEYEQLGTMPQYLKNRKFELVATVQYNEDNLTETYRRNFDWMNTNWQYCAVPIQLDKNKTVANITYAIDYSYNTGKINFTDCLLMEATFKGEIRIPEQNLIQHYDSSSIWTVLDELDDDEKLVNRTYTNKDTGKVFVDNFYYNKQGRLFKTVNYNGLVTEKVFNENGIEIKTMTYHKDNPAEIMYTEQKLNEKGEVISDINELGEEINTYEYLRNGHVSTITDKQNNKTAYGYNSDGTMLQMSADANGTSNTNTYGYTLDFLTKVSHNDFDIAYDYDSRGRVVKIKVADNDYLNFNYDETNHTNTVTYSNNQSFRSVTDKDGNVIEVYYRPNSETEEILLSQNIYDTHGRLMEIFDYSNGIARTLYQYDKFGNCQEETTSQHGWVLNKINLFDENNLVRQSGYTYNIENTNDTNTVLNLLTYDNTPNTELVSIKFSNNTTQKITRDNLGRTKELSLEVNPTTKKTISRFYHYLKNGTHTSNQVSSIWYKDTNDVLLDNLKYSYDEKGNITHIRENGNLIARYSYDALSRLVREDNLPFRKTTTFEYDAGGNITYRNEYAFTLTNDLMPLDDSSTKSYTQYLYTYSHLGIKDQLMGYNGETFEYDACGNPTTYRGNILEWSHGRQLDAFGNIATYTYNSNGIRTSKTVGNTTSKYYLDNYKILAQKDTSDVNGTEVSTLINFIYGLDGLIGFNLVQDTTTSNYFYKKNLQGDIIGIYNETGTMITKYIYDAWGNHKIQFLDSTGNFVDFDPETSYNTTIETNLYIALKNPFRYRGYYYDTETKLYYLNSRYYDAELGRFINIDDISVLSDTQEILNGLNLYAYCFNNPIMATDDNGDIPNWLKWLLGGLLFIAAVALTVVTGGAALPLIIGFTANILVSGLVGGTISVVNGGDFWQGFNNGAADGALWGGALSFLGAGINAIRFYSTTTKLFRAVSSAEYASIKTTGQFSVKFGQMEGKFFATTKKNASMWKSKLNLDNIVKIRVPKSKLKDLSVNFFNYKLDDIGNAYYFSDIDFLNSIVRKIRFY